MSGNVDHIYKLEDSMLLRLLSASNGSMDSTQSKSKSQQTVLNVIWF